MSKYIVVKIPGKRPGLRGPYTSLVAEQKLDRLEDEALERKNGQVAEILDFPTRNLNEASRMFKERRIDEEGFEEGIRNLRHKGVFGKKDDG